MTLWVCWFVLRVAGAAAATDGAAGGVDVLSSFLPTGAPQNLHRNASRKPSKAGHKSHRGRNAKK